MILKNQNLKTYNTFGINIIAKNFAVIKSLQDLITIINSWNNQGKILVLGGGSNILFTQDFNGLVLKNEIEGIEIEETENEVYLTVGSGVVWHELVMFAVENQWYGIENLSLIPGTVGASPIQNIGAYGVELKSVFVSLQAFDYQENIIREFNNEECNFGYRDSIFKREWKNKLFILSVTFKLQKQANLNLEYGAIQQEIYTMETEPTISTVSQAVINIRTSKLPDPKELGNAGSFFKNPEVSLEKKNELLKTYTDLSCYPLPNGNYKLAAGWLIEQCGWKGKNIGQAGCHAKQALVLVNLGQCSGYEIVELSKEIQKSVWDKFEVEIEAEVNII